MPPDSQPPSVQTIAGDAPVAPPNRVPWPPILFLSALVVAHLGERLAPLPLPLGSGPAHGAGMFVTVAGFGLMGWAFLTFWRARANILPHRAADRLIETGPFRWSRNPIYLSEAVVLFGFGLMDRAGWYWLVLPVFMLAVTRLAIVREERHMAARFGPAWAAFSARVRRWA